MVGFLFPRYWEIGEQTSVGGLKIAGFFYRMFFSNGNVLLKGRWVTWGIVYQWKRRRDVKWVPTNIWCTLIIILLSLLKLFYFFQCLFSTWLSDKKMQWTRFPQLALRIKWNVIKSSKTGRMYSLAIDIIFKSSLY